MQHKANLARTEKYKESQWREKFYPITHNTLFQGETIASGRKPSPLISTITFSRGVICSSKKNKAQFLFDAIRVDMAPGRSINIDTLMYPLPNSALPSEASVPPFPDTLTPKKIKDTVFERAPMKASGPNVIQNWLCLTVRYILSHHISFFFHNGNYMWHTYTEMEIRKKQSCFLSQVGLGTQHQDPTGSSSLLNTLSKAFKKHLATAGSHHFQYNHLYHQGHYGADHTNQVRRLWSTWPPRSTNNGPKVGLWGRQICLPLSSLSKTPWHFQEQRASCSNHQNDPWISQKFAWSYLFQWVWVTKLSIFYWTTDSRKAIHCHSPSIW